MWSFSPKIPKKHTGIYSATSYRELLDKIDCLYHSAESFLNISNVSVILKFCQEIIDYIKNDKVDNLFDYEIK